MTTATNKPTSTTLVPVEKGKGGRGDRDEVKTSHIGRPLKLSPNLIEKLSDIIREGHYAITACQACGIHKVTLYDWLAKGAKDIENGANSLFSDLAYALKKAEADAEQALLSIVKDKAINGKEWLPAMTILERRHPERWGRKDRSTLVVEETKRVIITTVEVVKDYGNREIEEKGG